jgi:prepilin-type N-terminal cleavage/methylation domain-containing protein
MRDRRGMTLIEMMVALVVFTMALTAAMAFLRSQSVALRKGVTDMDLTQNLSYGAAQLMEEIRMAGNNVPSGQPDVVYADTNIFAFNADLVSNVSGDISSVYVDPDAPSGQVTAFRVAKAITLPNTTTTYPTTDYKTSSGVVSPAETIIYWFAADTSTSRSDDYVLWRQVNAGTAEVVSRNILKWTGKPFFQYQYLNAVDTASETLASVASGKLPVKFSGTLNDSLRTVQVNYVVTNGFTGTDERKQYITFTVGMPNVGQAIISQCGSAPIFSSKLTAAADSVAGIDLSWNPSGDDGGGENDVLKYVIWRRTPPATDWGDPIIAIPSGLSSYTYSDKSVTSATVYQYAVAAQDCTPTLSSQSISTSVTAP